MLLLVLNSVTVGGGDDVMTALVDGVIAVVDVVTAVVIEGFVN